MSTLVRSRSGVLLLLLAGLYAVERTGASEARSPDNGETVAERSSQLVAEALHREIYGLNAERERLLDLALKTNPGEHAARWHKGLVRHNARWVRADEIPKLLESDSQVAEYRKLRDTFPKTVAGQLKLADWCAEHALNHREQAHLWGVLHLDWNHDQARKRLGFKLIDGRWVGREEQEEDELRVQAMRRSLLRWGGTMESVLELLDDKSAARQVLDSCDESAICAMEVMLAARSEPAARVAVERLARMNATEATRALARQTAYSRWPVVREAAAKQLLAREPHDYVPFLLSNLLTLLEPSGESIRYQNGSLVYKQTFDRESKDRLDRVVQETIYRRVAREGGDRTETLIEAANHLTVDREERDLRLAQMNGARWELNERIFDALRIATEQPLGNDPRAWWQWWNDQNEVYVDGQKPQHIVLTVARIDIQDRVPPPRPPGQKDCLAAGTSIWTAAGAIPVEQVQVGDLVLAQNVNTGELAYKAVLRATTRPPAPLIRIRTAHDRIECSGGHAFWISGEGWVKARDIASGMVMHSVNGGSRVSTAESLEREAATFNLEVADFHTFFVGQSKVLSHDNTVRRPTDAVVPGLAER